MLPGERVKKIVERLGKTIIDQHGMENSSTQMLLDSL